MRWVKDFLLQLGLSWPPRAPLAAKCILERATQGTLRERFHFLALYLCPSKLLPLCQEREGSVVCTRTEQKGGLGRWKTLDYHAALKRMERP